MSISIYICYIVTKPGNLIRLFVNELEDPTRVQDNCQCCVRVVCVCVCVRVRVCVGTCVITATINVIEIYFNLISNEIQN
jgi:hypothetical protein